ncbi:MAG: hypothetical protein ABW252_11430 [Polyangiales bacterium]
MSSSSRARWWSRSPRFAWLLLTLAQVWVGCAADLERYEVARGPRGSMGEEAYKVMCRRLAGTTYPDDIAGKRSQKICMGSADEVREAAETENHPARLIALARRRASFARAVDLTFGASLSDPLEKLMRNLVPFYDLPDERVQSATREMAGLLERIAGTPRGDRPADLAALSGLARLSAEGMAPVDTSLGLPRALLGASGLKDMAAQVLPLTVDDHEVKPAYDALLASLALELATSAPDADDAQDVADLKAFLLRTRPEFASGRALYASLRDARGHPIPAPLAGQPVPPPFVDGDGDGLADVGPRGLLARDGGAVPAPFPAFEEPPTTRDAVGRALDADGRTLYREIDLDGTLLAALLRAGRGLFDGDALVRGLAGVATPLAGDPVPAQRKYGALEHTYTAPDARVSPLRDLVHASGALVDQPVIDDALAFGKRMLTEQEPALAGLLEPLLALERRTRPGADAYPAARLADGHTLWEDLLGEVEKLSRRRIPGEVAGDTMLEALTRASLGYARNLQKPGAPVELLHDPALLRRQGSVYAALMRFKDEWRANPKGESQRAPGEPTVLGGLRVPVDRSQPDAPVTCGRDGCGGLIDETPFTRWKTAGQNCVLQRSGRPITGKDCGAPANQSLFQRSMGLIAEMAGRAQCNKDLTLDDLLSAASKDPCVGEIKPDSAECQLLRQQQVIERQDTVREAEAAVQAYACPPSAPATAPCRAYAERFPAAFVDPDGPSVGVPSTIRACHMLDMPDVGRQFGAVLLGTYTLDFPNPWVRRYLEDIARAGDHDGDGAQDLPTCTVEGGFANFPILDPKVAPACVPEAARLSRNLYDDMPATVDTLGEMVAYMLDDSTLFASDADRAALRPDPKALSRVLFAASASDGFVMFDPLLVQGAPPLCSAARQLPACVADDSAPTPAGGCCIEDPKRPPLRYRLDTYYGATTFAWEHALRLADGRSLSFLDTMKSVSDAIARYDFDAARGDDPRAFEDLSYPFSTLGKLVAQHYDTARNPVAQSRDPGAPHYRRLTGLASYEALIADAIDDGGLALDQLGPGGVPLFDPAYQPTPEQKLGLLFHAQPLVVALSGMRVGAGDGIDLSSELAEQMLNPHARCAGPGGDRRVIAGEGACHRAMRGDASTKPPLTDRAGRPYVCARDGRCFDGVALPLRFAAPAHQLVSALAVFDDRQRRDPTRDRALRSLLGGALSGLVSVRDGRFADRRALGLLLELLDHTAEDLAEERAKGTLDTARARADADLDALLAEPTMAALLGFFDALRAHPEAHAGIAAFAASLFGERERPLAVGLFDALQQLPASADGYALSHALAGAFARDAERLVRTGGASTALAPGESASGRSGFVLAQTARHDDDGVLPRVLHNFTTAPSATEHAPMQVLLGIALEIDRVEPGRGGPPDVADLQSHLRVMSDVMRDDRRGFERIYDMLRCASHPQSDGCER